MENSKMKTPSGPGCALSFLTVATIASLAAWAGLDYGARDAVWFGLKFAIGWNVFWLTIVLLSALGIFLLNVSKNGLR